MKDKIKKFLEKLAEANEKEFGNERLDCCEVGKKQNKDNKMQANVKKH